MTDVLVYATQSRAATARALLGAACAATGESARLELYGTGSLYQRLGHAHSPPPPDLVLWWGPFAARAAAIDGLLQPFRPSRAADGAVLDPDAKWIALDYSTIGIRGSTPVPSWEDLSHVPKLAMPDPERSEVGLAILLATLDRARNIGADTEQAWAWWRTRASSGLVLTEDEAAAANVVAAGSATHALTTAPGAQPLEGLRQIPHAVALSASSRNGEAAKRVLDWLVSESAADLVTQSPWRVAVTPIDVEWARQQYVASRQRWAAATFDASR